MNKEQRLWVKQEKRIVTLMYQKGLITGKGRDLFYEFKLEDLYWAEYKWLRKKKYKSKGGYKYPLYMPEIHFGTVDYWGECDEHSLVDNLIDSLYWEHVDYETWDETSGEFPKSKFPRLNRVQLIKYLKGLPTKINDNKIRKILNRSNNYE